ncbi:hypothetical protein KBB27_01080 [Patescibacteria group bacterium]|nr:hypothetical protein [Patescibacteria group bacterium]
MIRLLFINDENSVTGKPRMVVYIVDTAWTFEVTSTGELELVHEHHISFNNATASFNDVTASSLRQRTKWDVYREHPELRAFLEEQYPADNLFATVPTGEVWVRELGSSPLEARKGLEAAIVMEVRFNWRVYVSGERILLDEAEKCRPLEPGEHVAIVWRECWRWPETGTEMTAWYSDVIRNVDGHMVRTGPQQTLGHLPVP